MMAKRTMTVGNDRVLFDGARELNEAGEVLECIDPLRLAIEAQAEQFAYCRNVGGLNAQRAKNRKCVSVSFPLKRLRRLHERGLDLRRTARTDSVGYLLADRERCGETLRDPLDRYLWDGRAVGDQLLTAFPTRRLPQFGSSRDNGHRPLAGSASDTRWF